ncbi:hypothetical protein F53441_11257 [Fusarium austroafricanum]|uniref:Bacteriophage T5 Orf172 DNA-binding domain-containing protein n=1 Tax=Fusarium austroafricanum TaxID=2364996 RepID=A0A8H4K3K6_9HYPO|nr:hypothetical protein F53441_11257 [Fusarium austroafricanum]
MGRRQNYITDEEDEQNYTAGRSGEEEKGNDKEEEEVEEVEEEVEEEEELEIAAEPSFEGSPQRPKLVRESPIGEREVPVTPVRGRVSRPGNSHLDDSGSVTSPCPSEIFTPTSAASTPFFVINTTGYESCRPSFRNGSYVERYEESPTRKKGPTDTGLDSRDTGGRMKSNENNFRDESREVKPEGRLLNSSPSRQPMTFRYKEKLPVHNILVAKKKEDDNKVNYRLKTWEDQCNHDLDLKFEIPMACAVNKMESLIHLTLHKESRTASCPEIECTRKHREWFEISEDEARSVVEIWHQFGKLMPYDDWGNLKDEWKEYASGILKEDCVTPAKMWLKTDLVEAMGKTIQRSDEDKLWHALAQIREKRKTIVRQLLQAEQDEDLIQKRLIETFIRNEYDLPALCFNVWL